MEELIQQYNEVYQSWLNHTITYEAWAKYCINTLDKLMIINEDILKRLKNFDEIY